MPQYFEQSRPDFFTSNTPGIFISALTETWTYMLSHVWLFVISWTVARQAPLSLEILQAWILVWVAIPFSRRSSQPRDRTQVSLNAGKVFTLRATREAQEYWRGVTYPFSWESSQPRNQTRVSCISGEFFTTWATQEAHESVVRI